MGPRGAGWRGYEDRPRGGRVREWTWGGVRLGPGYKDRPSGTARPVRVEWGRVGLSRAEWGWGGVGHALVDRPSGAAWGRVGPVSAEWGWGGVGHALGFN